MKESFFEETWVDMWRREGKYLEKEGYKLSNEQGMMAHGHCTWQPLHSKAACLGKLRLWWEIPNKMEMFLLVSTSQISVSFTELFASLINKKCTIELKVEYDEIEIFFVVMLLQQGLQGQSSVS